MLRRAGQNIRPHFRRLHQQTRQVATSIPRTQRKTVVAAVLVSGVGVGSYLWHSNEQTIYNDAHLPASVEVAVPINPQPKPTTLEAKLWNDPNVLCSLVWGSNDCQVLDIPNTSGSPAEEGSNSEIRRPMIVKWLENAALRDLQLHRNHAACVDARGDVYQWGAGFFGPALQDSGGKPIPTLRGKNIVQLQLTEFKVYALSASGSVYILAADALGQEDPAGGSSSSSSWLSTGWLLGGDKGKNIQYKEVSPKVEMSRNEKFISISAGDNHLLALTNKGRAFAHPVSKEANQFGQLGFRSFEITDPANVILGTKPENLKVDLVPKTVKGSSKPVRVTLSSDVTADLSNIDDSKIHWCTYLYEIPSLRGVNVGQVAAGGRSSFVRTSTGRVLGWGANEYGQIGLGANVTLDMITVPTEIILSRMVPTTTRSKCLNVTAGGDLAAFTVERLSTGAPMTVDLLMCGNGKNGGLGNNTYTTAQGSPGRVKSVSGLLHYSDRTQKLEAIALTQVTISPTGHVLVALDASAESDDVGGEDLMAWGRNYDYELGIGKKSSLAMPVNVDAPDGERLMLMQKKAKEVLDLAGQVWKKGVVVQQRVVAGHGSSVVYWKIK